MSSNGNDDDAARTDEQAGGAAADSSRVVDLAQRASLIVQQSATILEEEIAAGIQAAREIEARFLDVESLRGGDDSRFSRRLRRDVHEVVDIVVDLIESGARGAGGLAVRAVSLKPSSDRNARRPVPGNIPTLTPSAPLNAGGTAEISMILENDSDTETDEFSFESSDLINAASGARIAAGGIAVSPTPVIIAPRGSSTVTVQVAIPEGAVPGVYSGLLQATRLDQLRAILTVCVE
jgi:hypothetical protein